jgi:multidrug efflux pump subunit AcrB
MDDPIVKTVDLTKKLLEVVISSHNYTTNELKVKANNFKTAMLNLKDIQDVTIYGDSDVYYKVELDEKKIQAFGLSPQKVSSAIQAISYIYPLGKIEGDKHYFLSTNNGAKTADELKNTSITISNQTVYLKDIAYISKTYEDTNTIYSINNQNAINLVLSQNKNGSAITAEKKVLEIVSKFNKLNKNINYKVVDNQSKKIKARLNTVTSNILLGIIIITLIVALLINTRMAFVIFIGIPTSFVIASAVFYIAGYSINLISLVGVLLALGIIVDDAIVVSEQIQQYIEKGMAIKDACLQGSKDMFKPVTIASLTTMFTFLPALMLSGTMGEVIKLIPIALSALVLASLVESFIFLPIHASHILKKGAKTLSWTRANKIYSDIIHLIMRHKRVFLGLFIVGVPLFTVLIIKSSHFQMFPSFDTTIVNIALKSNPSTTVAQSDDKVNKVVTQLLKHKDKWGIKNISSIAGYRRDSGGNTETYPYVSSISIELHELTPQNFVDKYITPVLSFYHDDINKSRQQSSQEVSKQIKKFLDKSQLKEKLDLIDLSVVQKKVGPIKADIKIGLVSSDFIKIGKHIKALEKRLNSIDGIVSVANSSSYGVDELKLKINPYGESLGLDERTLGQILANRYLDIKKGTVFDKNGIVDIKIKSAYKDDFEEFEKQKIVLLDGTTTTLDKVCEFRYVKSFEKITKENGETNFYVFANVDSKIITASEVLTKIDPLLESIRADGVKIVLKGEAEKNKELKEDMMLATTLAMVLVMLSMMYLFNSFRQTGIVMSVIPFSILGVLIGHIVMDVNIGMTSIIGALGLAGVVINDGIIMMTFLREAENLDEVFENSAKRFRPIVLTTVTTLIGISSLIFFPTGQAVIFQPMAIALGFGLAWGTVLNLIYLPVLYSFAYKLKLKDTNS